MSTTPTNLFPDEDEDFFQSLLPTTTAPSAPSADANKSLTSTTTAANALHAPYCCFSLHTTTAPAAPDHDNNDNDDVILLLDSPQPPRARLLVTKAAAALTTTIKPTIAKKKRALATTLPPVPRSAPVAFYHGLIDLDAPALRVAKRVLQHRTILGLDDFQAITGCDAFPWDTRFGAGVDVIVATPGARVLLRSTEAVPTFRPDERERFAHLAPDGTVRDRFLHDAPATARARA